MANASTPLDALLALSPLTNKTLSPATGRPCRDNSVRAQPGAVTRPSRFPQQMEFVWRIFAWARSIRRLTAVCGAGGQYVKSVALLKNASWGEAMDRRAAP
jgi:hypothetical protein